MYAPSAKRQRTDNGQDVSIMVNAPPAMPPAQYAAPAPPIMHPTEALKILDPQTGTPVAVSNVLIEAALFHPDLAQYLHLLASSQLHGTQAPQAMNTHRAVPARAVPGLRTSSPSSESNMTSSTNDQARQPRQALQPSAQSPAALPSATVSDTGGASGLSLSKASSEKRAPAAKKLRSAPAPKDTTFDKESIRAEKALDSNRSPFWVQDSLENMTAKIASEVTATGASWTIKKNAVTAIRDVVHAIILTQGFIGRQLRKPGSYDFELNFKEAIKGLSEEERARLGREDGGAWLVGLESLKRGVRAYCTMGHTLDEITALVTPESVESHERNAAEVEN